MAVTRLVVLFFVSAVLVVSESYDVTPYRQCYSRDNECLRNYFQYVVWEAAQHGIPALGIPVLDPVVIENYRASVPGWVDLELVDGVGQGLRTCIVNKFELNFEKRHGSVDIICDGIVEGHYKIFSNSSLIRNLLNGDTIYGDGTGQVKIEKLRIGYDFDFKVEQRGLDNFIYSNFDHSKFRIDILRGVSFAANNLYLGQQEASDTIVGVLNQYSKSVLDATGVPVLDGFAKSVYDMTARFLYNIPLRNYVVDDVSTRLYRL